MHRDKQTNPRPITTQTSTAVIVVKRYLGLAGAVQGDIHRDRRLVGFPAAIGRC